MRSMTHIGIAALVAAVGLVAGRSATAADDSAYDDWVQSVIRHCEGAQAPPDEVASCIQRAKREREHAVTADNPEIVRFCQGTGAGDATRLAECVAKVEAGAATRRARARGGPDPTTPPSPVAASATGTATGAQGPSEDDAWIQAVVQYCESHASSSDQVQGCIRGYKQRRALERGDAAEAETQRQAEEAARRAEQDQADTARQFQRRQSTWRLSA